MNYRKIYDQLINKARLRDLKKLPKSDPNYVYCERHHIVPKSIGGLNTDDNLVNLLPKEHFIAHRLLVKIYENEFGQYGNKCDLSKFDFELYITLTPCKKIKYRECYVIDHPKK